MKKLTAILAAMLTACCLTISVSAAEFTPSVQGKEAPDVETVQTESGEEAVALIYDESGAEVQGVTDTQLTITPVAQADEAPAEVADALQAAYEQVQAAGTLTDLVPEIEAVVNEIEGLEVENLVVRDLFDVSVDEETKALLDSGNSITITFQLGIGADDHVFCLHNYEGDQWELIDQERTVNNGNGTVTVTFDSLSPVAFVVENTDNAVPAGASAASGQEETSGSAEASEGTVPAEETGVQNGVSPMAWIGLGAAVVIAGGAVVLLKVKKK